MLKSKGRPVQGQISSKSCKIHLRGVVKVSVFTKATLFGRTYRYPRAMFCSQWLFVRHPYGDLYLPLEGLAIPVSAVFLSQINLR